MKTEVESFNGIPIIIAEKRFEELTAKEKALQALLDKYPELKDGQKLTPAAKRYKQALEVFLDKVQAVLSSKEMVSVFEVASLHGCSYKGESLGQYIADARKLLKP